MSLWELAVAIAAWNKAQGNEPELAPLTAEEYDRDMLMAAELRAKMH
jgi:hypothetical protein